MTKSATLLFGPAPREGMCILPAILCRGHWAGRAGGRCGTGGAYERCCLCRGMPRRTGPRAIAL
jgi:hypothetical protein